MSRNRDRLGVPNTTPEPTEPPPQVFNENASEPGGFSFVVPTEFVEIPSKGKYYPDNHPLADQETIEIKQMTAKEEDMLTSRTLLRKGIALERVIQSLIVDKRINPNTLLVGDRNAILIAARISGYGSDYTTNITCPQCGTSQQHLFDLHDATEVRESDLGTSNIIDNGDGTFTTTLPATKVEVSFRLLTGIDENSLLTQIENARKSKKEDVSDMNKKKHAAYKDPKRGEHDVVDPKPKLEDAVRNVWQKAGDELEETKDKAQYMKTPPAKTDVSTDTESEQDNDKVKKLKIKLDKEKDTDALEKQNITLQGQVELLKQKLENEKNKAIKPEPNPDTGEIPLTVGVAYKALRDKMKKEEKMNEARWEVEGRISYRGISSEDDFHMVIDAPSEKAAEAKVEKELEKARDRRKIGPGGGGNIEDFDIEHLERTTDRLSAPQTTYRNSYDPTQKEDKQPDIVDDKETKKEKSKGKALTGSPKTVVDTDPKVDYKN